MKRERGVFRLNAVSAKGRLGNGFWHNAVQKRTASVHNAERQGRSGEEVLNRFFRNLKVQITKESDEEDFYERVASILRTSPNANPLASLLDRTYMTTLDGAERERYVFSMSERVHKCVERFVAEAEDIVV